MAVAAWEGGPMGHQRPPWLLRPFDSHLTHLLCVVSHLAVRLTSDSGELTHHSHLTHIYLLTTDSLRTHLAKTPRLFYRFKIEISAIVSPKSSKLQEVTRLAAPTICCTTNSIRGTFLYYSYVDATTTSSPKSPLLSDS